MRRIRPEITCYSEICHESVEQFKCHEFIYKSIMGRRKEEGSPEITCYNEICHESFEQFICHQFTYKSIMGRRKEEGKDV